MATKGYKGKRNNVTFPTTLATSIEELAVGENRSFSQMVVILCIEAINGRGIKYDIGDYLAPTKPKKQ